MRVARADGMPRMRAAAALVAALTVLALTSACDSQPKAGPSEGTTYVALGDSYVSGAVGQSTGSCGRSKGSYPKLLGRALKPDTFRDASCGGATTADVISPTDRAGRSLPAQLDAVPANSDLVTLGIGANDGNLYPAIFYACFIEQTRKPAACTKALAQTPTILATTRMGIVATIRAIQQRAPRAEVVLVGYLRIAPDSGDCPALGADVTQVRQFAEVEKLVAETQAAAAEETGVTFVPVRDKSEGHDACAEDAWTNALTSEPGDGILLHPRAAGMVAVAKLVESAAKITS